MASVDTLPSPVLPSPRAARAIKCAMHAAEEAPCFILRRLPDGVGCEIHLVRRAIVEALMRTANIVKTEVGRQSCPHVAHGFVGVKVNVFVLHAAPKSFDKNVGVSSQLRRLATIRADVSG